MIIPKHEPEIVRAEAKRLWRGDDEKVPTTSILDLIFRGVRIDSRYQKAHEFETMIAIISRMDNEEVYAIESVWCNSKAQSCFEICLKTQKEIEKKVDEAGTDWADAIRASFHAYCLQVNGGHNGFDIVDKSGKVLAFEEPLWLNDTD